MCEHHIRLIEELKAENERLKAERRDAIRERDALRSQLKACEKEKAARQDDEFQRGADAAMMVFEEYLDPIFRSLIEVVSVAGTIVGIVQAGFGELPRRQIGKLSEQLMGRMSRADYHIERAAHKAFGENFRDQFDASFVRELYANAKHYYATDDSEPLLRQASEQNIVLGSLVQMRHSLAPGRKRQDVVIDWLVAEVTKIYEAGGCTQSEASEQLYNQLLDQADGLTGIEKFALKKLEMWAHGGDYHTNLWRNKRNRDRKQLTKR